MRPEVGRGEACRTSTPTTREGDPVYAAVTEPLAQIGAANALLVSTPEYLERCRHH